jgi:hypothetical protein
MPKLWEDQPENTSRASQCNPSDAKRGYSAPIAWSNPGFVQSYALLILEQAGAGEVVIPASSRCLHQL